VTLERLRARLPTCKWCATANDARKKIGIEGTVPLRSLRFVLAAAVVHPWLSAFAILAAYSVGLVAIAHISALRKPTPTSPVTAKHKTFFWKGQKRYRCPHCPYDTCDAKTLREHVTSLLSNLAG
jgi:hypothetical protein